MDVGEFGGATIDRQIPGHRVRDQPAHGGANAREFGVVVVLAIATVLKIAIVLNPIARNLGQKIIAHRNIDATAHGGATIFTSAGLDEATEGLTRLFHDHAERSARRVAPVKRPLRAAQHLDSLHIKQGHIVDVLTGDVDIIDVSANRRIKGRDGFIVTLRPQVVHVGRTQTRIVSTEKVGHYVDKVQRVVNLQLLYQLFPEGTNGDGYILHRGLPAFRGDNHLLELSGGNAR